jgi:hypothetical protein
MEENKRVVEVIISVEQKDDKEICIHHWCIAWNGRGVCRKCGAREMFFTNINDTLRARNPHCYIPPPGPKRIFEYYSSHPHLIRLRRRK